MISLAASTLALLAVLLLAYLVIKGGGRLQRLHNRNGSITIQENTSLGNRERLVVVDYNQKRFLLAVTSQSVTVIDSQNPSHRRSNP